MTVNSKSSGIIKIIGFLSLYMILACSNSTVEQKYISISGKVTDFEDVAIDSAMVRLYYNDFTTAYETYTDSEGYYMLKGIKIGNYAAMYVIRPKEYPRMNAVPEEDMRLEFWAWNVIADKDLVINPRYQKLELYGTTVFEEYGGRPELLVYFRPMSVTKSNLIGKDIYLDKAKMEKEGVDLCVLPEYIDVEVYADEVPLNVKTIQAIYGYQGEKNMIVSYLVAVDRPTVKPDKPYIIFKVVVTNKEHNEKGENIYFYELKNYY